MFRWLKKTAMYLSQGYQGKPYTNLNDQPPSNSQSRSDTAKVSEDIEENLTFIQNTLGKNMGVFYRRFKIGCGEKKISAFLVAVSGMVEVTLINVNILRPLMEFDLSKYDDDLIMTLKESVLTVVEVDFAEDLATLSENLFTGKVVLFLEGETKAFVISARAWEMRGIEQPVSETVIRGPRDSFNEDLSTNLSLLRRRIRDPKLRCEELFLGTQTHTKVVVCYVEGIVNEDILKEVYRRLHNINIDAILETGFIEQLIQDAPFSLFPTVGNSEKPDIIASQLLEGRVSIFVDGTPLVLTVPYLLINNFQVSEDYYSRPPFANFLRILRVLSFFISVLLPGAYVAVQYYHTILIPFSLLVRQATLRTEVPFQLYIEIIVMLLVFEIIRESGLRMPKPIGQAVSIVGALILGQAAVDAGLVGIPVVVVVALVGIAAFPINPLSEAISILRILFILAGATLGLFGMLVLFMVVLGHLASLRSFGIPYSAPIFPIYLNDWKDSFIRFPLFLLGRRPRTINSPNVIRQKWGGMSGEGMRGKE